jgi:hypothetical protein
MIKILIKINSLLDKLIWNYFIKQRNKRLKNGK